MHAAARRAGARSAPIVGSGLALAASRQDGGSGSTLVNSSVDLQPTGEYSIAPADIGDLSLWINGTEVSCYMESLQGVHPSNGNVARLLLQWTGDPATISTAELRWESPLVGRATKVTPPRVPTTYWVAPVDHMCSAQAFYQYEPVSVSELDPWKSQWISVDGADKRASYAEWFVTRSVAEQGSAHIDFRVALYNRMETGMAFGTRTGNAYYWYQSLRILGSGGGWNYVDEAITSTGQLNNETLLSCEELAQAYFKTGCTDYITGMNRLAGQGYNVERLGRRHAGTLYNTGNGFERALGRAINGANLMAYLGETLDNGLQFGDETPDGAKLGPAYIDQIISRALTRHSGGGLCGYRAYSKAGDLTRGTSDTTKVRINTALLQRDIVANGEVDITIPVQEISIPAGANLSVAGTDQMVGIALAWDGSAVVTSVSSVQTSSFSTDPFRGLWPSGSNIDNMVNLLSPNRWLGHVVIRVRAGGSYTAGTTVLPPSHGVEVSGLTAWYFLNSREEGQKSYMALGMVCWALIQYCELFPSGAHVTDVRTALKAVADRAWDEERIDGATYKHMKYITYPTARQGWVGTSSAGGGSSESSTGPFTNGMASYVYFWLSQHYGTVYADRGKWLIDNCYPSRAQYMNTGGGGREADQSFWGHATSFLNYSRAYP